MINVREKVVPRALSDHTFARRAAFPEVIQTLSHKYPPLAVQRGGEPQPVVLGLCGALRRQILFAPGRQCARSYGKRLRGEKVERRLSVGGEVGGEGFMQRRLS